MALPTMQTILPNLTLVTIGDTSMWFSLKTLMGFQTTGNPVVVLQDIRPDLLSTHRDAIDGGNRAFRVDAETFARLWTEQTEGIAV